MSLHEPDPVPVPALEGVSKSFGAVRALREVSLRLVAGQAHALAGENSAGKSTLIKTLAGVHRPDAGQVLLDGQPVTFHGPADARDAGVAVIYQGPTLFPSSSSASRSRLCATARGSPASRSPASPRTIWSAAWSAPTSPSSTRSRPPRPAGQPWTFAG